jgi:hypothetical protein
MIYAISGGFGHDADGRIAASCAGMKFNLRQRPKIKFGGSAED